MARPKPDLPSTAAQADEVRTLTLGEIAALPGLLGRVASAKAAADGFYAYRDAATSRRICIILAR